MIGKIIDEMIQYYAHDRKQIHHFFEVYGFARVIGEEEQLEEQTMKVLEIAAIVHDIGIKVSMEKYNSSAGYYQEIKGPAKAEVLLNKIGCDSKIIERVSYLIGHHHTYKDIQGLDYQILVEADFLVNIKEETYTREMIDTIKRKIFKTDTGLRILNTIFY